jgi:hypothetical protein
VRFEPFIHMCVINDNLGPVLLWMPGVRPLKSLSLCLMHTIIAIATREADQIVDLRVIAYIRVRRLHRDAIQRLLSTTSGGSFSHHQGVV